MSAAEGKFIVGVDHDGSEYSGRFQTPGDTTGEYTHTLTEAEMPAHTHGLTNNLTSGGDDNAGWGPHFGTSSRALRYNGNICGSLTMAPAGGNADHENTPPGYAVYVWRRTA